MELFSDPIELTMLESFCFVFKLNYQSIGSHVIAFRFCLHYMNHIMIEDYSSPKFSHPDWWGWYGLLLLPGKLFPSLNTVHTKDVLLCRHAKSFAIFENCKVRNYFCLFLQMVWIFVLFLEELAFILLILSASRSWIDLGIIWSNPCAAVTLSAH